MNNCGEVWWFHSELAYPGDISDQPPLPTKNIIQWIPFGPADVVNLEAGYLNHHTAKEEQEGVESDDDNLGMLTVDSPISPVSFSRPNSPSNFGIQDELQDPDRYVAVKRDSPQYLKVDLGRMRMGPIYWRGAEFFVRRSTWFLVPENEKLVEAYPVDSSLEGLLNARYLETLEWIEREDSCASMKDKYLSASIGEDHAPTIVEKIVPLISEDEAGDEGARCREGGVRDRNHLHPTSTSCGPEMSRYFLVFRQGCDDYARLCIEKKRSGGTGGNSVVPDKKKPQQQATSKPDKAQDEPAQPEPHSHSSSSSSSSSSASSSSLPTNPSSQWPMGSMAPMSATSSLLSLSDTSSSSGTLPSPRLMLHTTSSSDEQSFRSFRLFRSYAAFYHALAGSISVSTVRVRGTSPLLISSRTQRQTLFNPQGEPTAKMHSGLDKKAAAQMSRRSSNVASTAAPFKPSQLASSAAHAPSNQFQGHQALKHQTHSFKQHPLPSPELENIAPPAGVRYLILVVHGVGQRAWHKIGLGFMRDCEEFRSSLLEASRARNVPESSLMVLPVSWRGELDLAGNFTFGDEDVGCGSDSEGDEETGIQQADRGQPDNGDKLNELGSAFSKLKRGVSGVLEGQFSELLEKLALDSIPAVRTVLSDATMDILLYVSPKHFSRILSAVEKEVVRLHRLFRHWNPDHHEGAKIAFVGHSLGSALVADLLSISCEPDRYCEAVGTRVERYGESSAGRRGSGEDPGVPEPSGPTDSDRLALPAEFIKCAMSKPSLPFKVDKFFALGSPLGVFHLLKHTKPIGCAASPYLPSALSSRVKRWRAARQRARREGVEEINELPLWTVYDCRLFYNLFHPHDPVAHRFESLPLGNSGKTRRCGAKASSNGADPSVSSRPAGASLPPPLKIPYHKSGLTRLKMDLEAKLVRAKEDWSRSLNRLSARLPTWLGGRDRDSGGEAGAAIEGAGDSDRTSSVSSLASNLIVNEEDPLAAFNHHFRRVDFSLQETLIENPYISALSSHFAYWADQDISAFILSEMIKRS